MQVLRRFSRRPFSKPQTGLRIVTEGQSDHMDVDGCSGCRINRNTATRQSTAYTEPQTTGIRHMNWTIDKNVIYRNGRRNIVNAKQESGHKESPARFLESQSVTERVRTNKGKERANI